MPSISAQATHKIEYIQREVINLIKIIYNKTQGKVVKMVQGILFTKLGFFHNSKCDYQKYLNQNFLLIKTKIFFSKKALQERFKITHEQWVWSINFNSFPINRNSAFHNARNDP